MQDLTPVVGDNEEAIENPKRQSRHSEEVHCGDSFTVIGKNVAHCRAGPGFLGALRIQFSTVRSEISKPSIFNSP
jgi:hypothetical protein